MSLAVASGIVVRRTVNLRRESSLERSAREAPRALRGFPKNVTSPAADDDREPAVPALEAEGASFSYADEKYQNRAWPAAEVDLELSRATPRLFAEVGNRHDDDEQMPFNWRDLGPRRAVYPAILGRTGASYVASGRITALAIDPNCNARRCRLWVGAAGGGIWRTERAMAREGDELGWKFVSGSFESNAIGSITVDPTDPSGDTLYVGTGEPNVSADSEAGVGIYKTANGGDTWTRLAAVATVGALSFPNFPRDRAVSAVAIDPGNAQTLYVGLARAVRGVGGSGGATSNPPPAARPAPFGVYKSTDGGATFTRIWDANNSVRGVTDVQVDPRNPTTVYASALQQGLWRSEQGGPFLQVFRPTNPTFNTNRTEFALTVKSGHTRIYLGDGAQQAVRSSVWRADIGEMPAAVLLATQTAPAPGGWKRLTTDAVGTDGYATWDYCTGQCWYDNAIFTPAGQPDTVFVLGSFQYNESFTFTNARAVVRSTTAGEPDPAHGNRTFTDMTFDATSASTPNSIHPDQHHMVFFPGNPEIWFEGSDGGLMRSSGQYVDASAQCDSRRNFNGTPLNPAQMRTCKQLLSQIPTRFTNLNFGLSTIQFQTLSFNPKDPLKSLMGGTQDNGTFSFTGSTVTWKQTGGGDGGFSGYNVVDPNHRFRTNFGQFVHGTRSGDDPNGWYHIGGAILFSPEGSQFYMPVIYDPHPAAPKTIFAGSQGVWRSQNNGGDAADLEARCRSTQTNDQPTCGDFVELGGPAAPVSPGDLTTAARGNRVGGFICAMARAPSDTGTLWVATTTGRIFISSNADGPAAAVTYTRLDSLAVNDPPRYPGGIVVDPKNPWHAWISYSGYSGTVVGGADPNVPGHVFEVNYDGATATWTRLDDDPVNPLPDLPINSIERDNATGDLFVATDFGVLRQPAGTPKHWHVAGSGMPAVEVTYLTISQTGRVLYASTHGRGAYQLKLRGANEGDDGNDGEHDSD